MPACIWTRLQPPHAATCRRHSKIKTAAPTEKSPTPNITIGQLDSIDGLLVLYQKDFVMKNAELTTRGIDNELVLTL